MTGGTLARAAADGHRVVLVVATIGMRGADASRASFISATPAAVTARSSIRTRRTGSASSARAPTKRRRGSWRSCAKRGLRSY
ncbi:hypothetical protein LCL61_24085 [Amycolatopsis coloradensis]|uniref:Uncharacterized protein n=1 Tax=Amycolatopsis coloradensis TaxID=76021 RepID=A0ACD5BH73_9PSEU